MRWGNSLVKLCLAGLVLLLAGCVAFIAHAMLLAGPAWWITSGTAVAILLLMTVLPRGAHDGRTDLPWARATDGAQ